jgi:hypothetical protein
MDKFTINTSYPFLLSDKPQPQEHPAHFVHPPEAFFFLSRRIFRIIAVTIPSKNRAVKIVPMFSVKNVITFTP